MGYHWNHLDDLMVWLKIITRLVRLTKQGATCWGLRQLGFLAVGCVELLETSGRWRCSFVPGSSCTSHLAGWMPSGVATNSIFFCFLFAKKIIDLPGGKINDPSLGKILFSFVPPSNSLAVVSDPWRAFWTATAPFKGPRLASCVASGSTERQGNSQVCHARHGGPRTPSKTTDANLDCAFVMNALVYTDLWWW